MTLIPTPDIPGPVTLPRKPAHQLPPHSCDTHAHIFGPADRYPYNPVRSYTPPDASLQNYVRLLHRLGFERAVLIQPSVYGTDNRLLADALARSMTEADGIALRGVAVLDENVSDAELERLHSAGVRGARLNLLYKGGVDFASVSKLAQRIAQLDWHLQFLIDLTKFDDLAARLSRLPVESVIDHMGHFPATLGPRQPAFEALMALMREGRTWVKLSGPNRLSANDSAPFPDAQVLARALIGHMPERLVFGTDWPHVALTTTMPDDGDLVDEFFRWIDNDARLAQQILVDNPARLYSFLTGNISTPGGGVARD
jgi:predicted TIM-barrel fold metal-dependent hydrolase